jgi:hypothetical protein
VTKRVLTRRNAAIAGIAGVIAAPVIWETFRPKDVYREFLSPDGRFKVTVYRFPFLFGTMPGQSGDAPGEVRLYRTDNGKILKRTRVEMVQRVDHWTWTATNVNIKFVADWELPSR